MTTITPLQLRDSLDAVVARVAGEGETFVISPVRGEGAAIVPLHVLEDYERRRRRLENAIDRLHAEARDSDPDEVERSVARAVAETRAARRGNPATPEA